MTKEKLVAMGFPTRNDDAAFWVGGQRDVIREWVRIRDNRTCQKCGKIWIKGQRRFDVHHLDLSMEGKSKERGIGKWDEKNIGKLITYCHKCHLNLHSVKEKMKQKHKN